MGKLKEILSNPFSNDYYLIGETAYHHAGDYDFLKKMVDDLLEIGVDAIKFHIMLNRDNFATPYQIEYEDIKTWLFSKEKWEETLRYVSGKGVDIIVLPDEIEAMNFAIKNAQKFNIEGIEIHAASLNEYFMLEKLNEYDAVRILGIGGSNLEDINYALGKIKNKKYDNMLLMYGIQNYPTDHTRIKLKNLQKLKQLYNLEVGYADHTSYEDKLNVFITIVGYLMGGRIIEKHYSRTPGVRRNDFESAVSKEQLEELKELLSISKQILGEGDFSLNKEELAYGKIGIGKKALVAKNFIKKNTALDKSMVLYKLTNVSSFLKQNFIEIIEDFVATKDIEKEDIIDFSKLEYKGRKK